MGPTGPEPEPTIPLQQPYPQGSPPSYPGGYDSQPPAYGYPQQHPHLTPNPYEPPGPPNRLVHYPVDPRQQAYEASLYAAQKSRLAAGLLGILLGTLGVHNFYLGRTGIGILQLLLSVLSFGFLAPLVWIWALIEGILILTGSPSFATDRRGIPLRS